MNKKFVISLLAVVLVSGYIAYASSSYDNSNEFLNAFKNCSEYNSNDTIVADGLTSNVTKNIIGWDGYTCKYEEIIVFKELGFRSKVNCEFSGEQVRARTS